MTMTTKVLLILALLLWMGMCVHFKLGVQFRIISQVSLNNYTSYQYAYSIVNLNFRYEIQ